MKPASIMIVENNTDLRNRLRHAFEDRGYNTWSCPALGIAVALFEAIHPAVVILDLDFEGVNSLSLLDTWRELSPQTRIIVEATNADDLRIREAMGRGAHAFLTKPYALPPLFDLLEKDIPSVPPTSTFIKKAA